MSDSVLVLALHRHQQEALAELYRRHGGVLFSLAFRVLRARELAEEVVQDIFVRLWNSPERFEPERGELRPFLLAQAHRRAIDVVRSETFDATVNAYCSRCEFATMCPAQQRSGTVLS